MGKIVYYNGDEISRGWKSDDPSVLKVGGRYEVVDQMSIGLGGIGFRTMEMYSLKGVKGWFEEQWFYGVYPENPHYYFAIVARVPVIGEEYDCSTLNVDDSLTMQCCHLHDIVNVFHMGDNFYRVITRGNVYIVQVNQ